MIYRQVIYHAAMDDISSKLLYGCLETLVLAVLAKAPLHGYALKWILAEKSKYHVQPGFGRLYPLLATLERRGWIAGSIESAGRSRVRKVYAITSRGRTRLEFLIRQWNGFQSAVNTFLKPPA